MTVLKKGVKIVIDATTPLAFPQVEGGLTLDNLMAYQWKNLSIAQNQSVYDLNQTFPGYVEYGAYLDNYHPGVKSNLTIERIKTMMALNDFVGFDRVNKRIKNKVEDMVDDSHSLLNKKNMDGIFAQNTDNDSIKFINDVLQLNDLQESNYLFKYLSYLGGEMAFQFSTGGTKGIGGLSQMMAQFWPQMLSKLGYSLFFNSIKLSAFDDFFEKTACADALGADLYPGVDINAICTNSDLNTQVVENLLVWIDGVVFGTPQLKTLLQCTDEQYYYITNDNSKIRIKIMTYVDQFMTLYKDYISGPNIKTANFLKLAGFQFIQANVTSQFHIAKYSSPSISNKNWDLVGFPRNNYLINNY